MVDVRQCLADLPSVIRRVHAAGDERGGGLLHDGGVLLACRRDGLLVAMAEHVVAKAKVADDKRRVRWAVQIADVEQATGVLLLGERVQQGVRGIEQACVAIVSTASVDERRGESQGVLGKSPRAGTRCDLTLV